MGLQAAWFVMLARSTGGFTAAEQDQALQAARLWRAWFDRPVQPEAARAIYGRDGRLIHADPAFHLMLIGHRCSASQAFEALRTVHAQRWGADESREAHDMVIDLGDRPVWAIVRLASAVEAPECDHWLIELREAGEQDMPPVGALSDERIARTLGYIHD
ncbi:MAG: hypothetical protein VYC34_05475, partial [Planctomycetota bacterium]|nr:hypothetical protein [Planctomycetota bacterium]